MKSGEDLPVALVLLCAGVSGAVVCRGRQDEWCKWCKYAVARQGLGR